MPEWGYMVDPDQLIKEMLALKISLEDFSKRMEKVESVLFNKPPRIIYCGHPGCGGHYESYIACV
jgi:hypothetical protein